MFAKGAVIIRKGDIGEDMFFIKSGKVAIVLGNPACCGKCIAQGLPGEAGQTCCKAIAILSKGDCFGEQALLDKTTRNASAIALSPCTLYSLSHEDFDHAVSYNGYEDNVMTVLHKSNVPSLRHYLACRFYPLCARMQRRAGSLRRHCIVSPQLMATGTKPVFVAPLM